VTKSIVFVSGTRADFGKLKSLISITKKSTNFKVYIFATGMHLDSKYGNTVQELYKSGFDNIYEYPNYNPDEEIHMDRVLAKTIEGFSSFIETSKPDLVVVHGDRVETLACAISASLKNIRVAHIEGGEVSGTIDELIRHAVTKMSHIHLVSNIHAKNRLIQLGELEKSISIIGSPDIDLMNIKNLPDLETVKNYYEIFFDEYAIAMFHPVTTEYDSIVQNVRSFVCALEESNHNYVLVYPNNDLGSSEIIKEYERLNNNPRFRIFPSLRFEYFLSLLNSSKFIIGNSSAGIREASYFFTPSVDIGTRQKNRAKLPSIFHTEYKTKSILLAIDLALKYNFSADGEKYFGSGNSDKIFLELLESNIFWDISTQKEFVNINQHKKNY